MTKEDIRKICPPPATWLGMTTEDRAKCRNEAHLFLPSSLNICNSAIKDPIGPLLQQVVHDIDEVDNLLNKLAMEHLEANA